MINEGRRAPDLGMPSQAGNNLLYALVQKAKSERELLSMIDKLALKMGGKYKDAKDELITRAALDAFNNKGNKGEQGKADRNVFVQLKGAADLSGGGEIKLDDKSSVKVSKRDAEKIVKNLMKLKSQDRGKVQKAMQKSKKDFNKFLKILNR
tara:strand:+ start:938 stop:1393 length:456 start_codon:yes stop_codon:yes gene_type:complete